MQGVWEVADRPQPVDGGAPDRQQPPAARGHGRLLVEPAERLALPRRGDLLADGLRPGDPRQRTRRRSRSSSRRPSRTRRWASTSTTRTPRRTRPTRTSDASCSSCTPSASTAATPRTTSRRRPGCSPATASTSGTGFQAYYDKSWHDTQPVQILGFHHANGAADGRAATDGPAVLPGEAPGNGAPDRRAVVREVRLRPADAGDRQGRRQGLPSTTAPRSSRPCGRSSTTRTSPPAPARRSARRPRTTSPRCGRSASSRWHRPSDDSFVNAMYWQYSEAGQPPYEWSTPERLPRGRPVVGGRRTAAHRLHDAPRPGRALVAHRRRPGSRRWPRSFRRCRPPSARSSTTVGAPGARSEAPQPRSATGSPSCWGCRSRPASPRTTRCSYWTLRGILSSLLDSPLHLHR